MTTGNSNTLTAAPGSRLTAFPLKVIAIAAMLINHLALSGLIGYEQSKVFYIFALVIGKLTFPIMAYLLVEGYHYTSNVKKYVLRLAMFWLLSIVPFWLAFYYPKPFTPFELVNNVMFTLLMGLLLIIVCDKVKSSKLEPLLVIVFSLLTIQSDWMVIGVLMIYGFYRVRDPRTRVVKPILSVMIPFLLLMGLGVFAIYQMGEDMLLAASELIGFMGLLLPIPLLLRYNGQRGYSPAWVKWGFYLFYPIHLLILGLITM